MEVFDVGTLPAHEALDALFREHNLSSLLGSTAAACFALVRSALAPKFYHRLIATSADIDATTRHHLGFVVFYGSKASFLRPANMYDRDYLARYTLARSSRSVGVTDASGLSTTES